MSDQNEQVAIDTTHSYTNVKKRRSEQPKPSMALKRAWHAACFQPCDRHGKGRSWRKLPGAWMPLKQFAMQQNAETWLANKRGASNEKRSDQNIARVAAERSASHSARGK
jgi:hypothetical protein